MPVGLFIQADAVEVEDKYVAGQHDSNWRSNTVMLTIFTGALAWIIRSNWAYLQEHKSATTAPARTEDEGSGRYTAPSTYNIDDEGYGTTPPAQDGSTTESSTGEGGGSGSSTKDGSGTTTNGGDKPATAPSEEAVETRACPGDCTAKVTTYVTKFDFENAKIYLLDKDNKRQDKGLRMPNVDDYGDKHKKNFQKMEDNGLFGKGFTEGLSKTYERFSNR